MTTPRTRAIVSLAATMPLTLALGACVRGPSRPALDRPASMEWRELAIHFDNDTHERVQVYLIGEQREWLLGRVEPGARATLRLPDASLAGSRGFVRLAVIKGEGLTLQAARDPRAAITIAQPPSAVLSQRWMFSQGQLTPLQHVAPRAGADRP